MPLMLNSEECAALKQALDAYLPELQMERIRAERSDVRHALVILENQLLSIRRRLNMAEAALETPLSP